MLGERLEDRGGVDGDAQGLGLLPLVTVFARSKVTRRVESRFEALAEPWAALSGLAIDGYEIRHGQTTAREAGLEALEGGLGFARGAVLGISLHGLFENAAATRALFGAASPRPLEAVFDELADAAELHLDTARIEALAGIR